MGYDRFRKTFREVVGLSPGEYRIRRRIQEASRLLRSGTPVGEVAHRLGYADQFAFSKQFKSRTATAPGRYTAEQWPIAVGVSGERRGGVGPVTGGDASPARRSPGHSR